MECCCCPHAGGKGFCRCAAELERGPASLPSDPIFRLLLKSPPADTRDAGDTSSVPGSGRSPGEGSGNPLQYPCLGNPTERGAWWATVHAGSQRVGYTEPARTHALVLPDVCVLGPSHHFTSTVLITITRKNLDIPLCVQN